MAGGFTTTSAQRSTATSTVSSAVAVVNNPNGTGFAISGPALTADKVITQIVYVEGANTSSGGSTVVGGSGPTITKIDYLDTNQNKIYTLFYKYRQEYYYLKLFKALFLNINKDG